MTRAMPDLADRAKQRLLTRQEMDTLADRLERQETFDALTDQLIAMQLAGDARYQRAVDRYLDFREDLDVAARALQILCFNWRLADEYFDWLLRFVEGVEWDLRAGSPVIRPEAFLLAGYYLESHQSRVLLDLLLRIAEDDTERAPNRSDAAAAPMGATGVPAHLVPLELSTDDPWFVTALADARERLRSERDLPPREGRRPVSSRIRVADSIEPFLPAAALHSPLVRRAMSNGFQPAELDTLATELLAPASADQTRERLVTLLYAGDASYRDAVEANLDADEADIASLALLVLCAGWHLARDHLDRLALLIEQDNSIQGSAALAIAGGFLATRRWPPLLELLLEVAGDVGRPAAVRAGAVAALHRATAGFSGGTTERLNEQQVAEALNRARDRLERE